VSRIDQITKMLESEPDDVFLNFTLGLELAKGERREQAVSQFQRVIELKSDYSAAYLAMARCLIDLDRRDEARTALEKGAAVAQEAGDLHARDQMKELRHTLG
jgi:Flp pilus assembly protein TadD